MTTGRAPLPRRRLLDALFGEAHALERCVRIASVALPAGGRWAQLAAVGRRLVLTSSSDHSGRCRSATLAAPSMAVLSVAAGSCENPALYGERVLPVVVELGRNRRDGLENLGLRIATVASHVRGGYRLGAVLVPYRLCSGCRTEWVYGDGSLWVYAPLATQRRGVLLQISEQDGRVVRTWSMPAFYGALMAVNADGVWIAQSQSGGEPAHTGTAQQVAYQSLYRVAGGMRKPQRVFDLRTWGANWLVAAGGRVWLDVALGRAVYFLATDGATGWGGRVFRVSPA